MKERLYNKQNSYGDTYQMRTKQYSHANLQKQHISYSPKALQNNANISETPYERPQKNDYYQNYDYKKNTKYDRNTTNYGKADKVQIPEKYDFNQNKSKYAPYQFQQKSNEDRYTDHSFGESSLQNESNNPQNKRENAKRKGLQIKMSNINSISDKINNLLNMVKKDRIEPSLRDEQVSPKRTHSPVISRINSQSFQPSQNKSIKSGSKQANDVDYRDYSKSNQRVRTYSALQQKSNTKKAIKQQYKEKQYNNEQEKYNASYKKNYPPSSPQAQNKNKQQAPIRYKYQLNNDSSEQGSHQIQRKLSNYSPYNQKYRKDNYQQQFNQPVARKNNKNTQKTITPSKYQKIDLQQKSPQKIAYDRSKNNLQNNFMPITLVQPEKVDRSSFQQSQPGMKMIDDRLKRIKQKINQSQTQNKKYQQRLQGRQQNNYVGKIYINEPSHGFQLKVHPVVNDKPQTVKIAEKLAYQIEVDARIRRARQEFSQIEEEDKWRDLQLRLTKHGVRLTQPQIKELLTISPNQFSPFDRQETTQTSDLVKGFSEAQKHWQREVSGCATMKSLKSQGFNINELDLNKKGYLTIQDIVCFVNLYTGHSHRNRDLAIIFRRLHLLERNKNQSGIDFSTFYRAFAI